jgi:hypothetical protein
MRKGKIGGRPEKIGKPAQGLEKLLYIKTA